MFDRIAPRYDLLNRVLSFGRDASWRRRTVAVAGLGAGQRALDVGAGTGDLARALAKAGPSAALFLSAPCRAGHRNGPGLERRGLPVSARVDRSLSRP